MVIFAHKKIFGLQAAIESIKTSIVETLQASLVPTGAIMWFKRTTAPSGWAICDGTNGTPNLIGKYLVGATSGIGGTVDAGLPNITGAWAVQANASSENGPTAGQGAIKTVRSDGKNGTAKPTLGYTLSKGGGWNDGGYNNQGIEFSAKWCNTIYGNSNTVTPPSVKLLPCMKL